MRILILGGTGAMGIHLVELLKDENQLFVTSRKQKGAQGNVRYLQGDGKDLVFLTNILREKWDAIIDFMVYATSEFAERYQLFLRSTEQYIFLSSARVYADQHAVIKEHSPRLLDVSEDAEYLRSDEYGLAKARQEDLLFNSGERNWTIIRPYITYSENRLQLGVLEKEEWLYRALKGRTIVFSSDMMPRFTTLTYGFDVARGMAKVIGHKACLSKAYHITSHDPAKWEQVLETYLLTLTKKLHFRPKYILVGLDAFLKVKSSRYQTRYDRLFDRRFDNRQIGELINIDDFHSMQWGLPACLDVFLQRPSFLAINWKTEALKDRLTKERTPFNEIGGLKNKLRYFLYRYIKNV